MHAFLEVFTSIVAVVIVVIAMIPFIKVIEELSGKKETDKKNKRIK